MKRLLFIGALFVWSMACTNHEEKVKVPYHRQLLPETREILPAGVIQHHMNECRNRVLIARKNN